MIVSINGNLGAGKTHSSLEIGCQMANDWNKIIVTNIELNIEELAKWCEQKKYWHLLRRCYRNEIFYTRDIIKMMSYKGAVVILDEAGIYLNSRSMMGNGWQKFQPFIEDLLLSRKIGSHLVWTAQAHEHVAKEIRDVTNFYYHMINVYDKYKFRTMFKGYDYEMWLRNQTFQRWFKSMIAPKFYPFDQKLFDVYNTFQRPKKAEYEDLTQGERLIEDSYYVPTDEMIAVGRGESVRWVQRVRLCDRLELKQRKEA